MVKDRYDVAVIGGGPGGYVAGIRLGQLGKSALVIEREHLGGVCLNWGCIPSKAIIHAANLRDEIAHFGSVFSSTPTVDATALHAWKDGIIAKQRQGIAGLLKANGCDHVAGHAVIEGPNSVSVSVDGNGSTKRVMFDQLIIASGAGIIEIPGFSYQHPRIGFARHGVNYNPLPEELVIIGGGIIGCELGMAHAKMGSKVTIVEMMDSILPGTDKDLLRPLIKRFKQLGITTLNGAKAKGFEDGPKKAQVEIEIDGKSQKLPADKVLVAVGFRPNTQGLGLEKAGVKLSDRGWIAVDQTCRTNVSNIFAIGDVTGPPLLAHRASYMGEIAAEVIAGHHSMYDAVAMPGGIFTDPEIATVGLSEQEATTQGYEVRTGVFPLSALGRAAAMNATEGLVKVIVDAKSDLILGVGISAFNACDLIGEACLALEMGALAEDLALTVHVHPTLAEGLMEAAKASRGQAVHIINRKPRSAGPAEQARA
jgi:dihydrolipoamide dehydrogenase